MTDKHAPADASVSKDRPSRRSPKSQALIIMLSVALAFVIRLALDSVLEHTAPLSIFMGGVAVVTWYAGRNAGVVAAAISSLMADYFFNEPRHVWEFSSREIIGVFLFFGANLLLVLALDKLWRTRFQLSQSEQKNRTVLESIRDGFFSVDAQGRFTYINQKAAQYFGRSSSLLLGAVAFDVVADSLQDNFETAIRQTIATQAHFSFEHHRPAAQQWLSVNCYPYNGGVSVFFQDITNLKHAEAELLAMHEHLKQANAQLESKVQARTAELQKSVNELEYFSYTITHDMRAPLRAMRVFSDILLAECSEGLTPTHQDLLARISQSAHRMDHLITDALDYNKVARGQMRVEPLQPAALLQEMIATYPILQAAHAEVTIEGTIPPVLANAAGLTQCVSNILNNAVKFVAPGARPKIRIWAERGDAFVRLWFEDNGIGIAPEYQEKIFGMFERLSAEYEGTGIGLALVRKVAERMGGKVGVESEPGKGSRFWLELQPVEAESANLPHQESPALES